MVAMTMGVDNGYNVKVRFFGLGNDPMGIRAGIDYQGLTRVVAAHNVAEIIHVSGCNLSDDHPYSFPITRMKKGSSFINCQFYALEILVGK
jgi:hypothetical protein